MPDFTSRPRTSSCSRARRRCSSTSTRRRSRGRRATSRPDHAERTAAIMPVHAFGLAADMDPIMRVAAAPRAQGDRGCRLRARRHLPTAARAASATPAASASTRASHHDRRGRHDHDRTTQTLAERIAPAAQPRRRARGRPLSFEAAGFNYRLSDILAAVGVAQMRKLDALLAAAGGCRPGTTRRSGRPRRPVVGSDRAGLGRPTPTSPTSSCWTRIDRDAVIAGYARAGRDDARHLRAARRSPTSSGASVSPGRAPAISPPRTGRSRPRSRCRSTPGLVRGRRALRGGAAEGDRLRGRRAERG